MKTQSDILTELYGLLQREFEVLSCGEFQGLGELLCRKMVLLESLSPAAHSHPLLGKCHDLNQQLLLALGGKKISRSPYKRNG